MKLLYSHQFSSLPVPTLEDNAVATLAEPCQTLVTLHGFAWRPRPTQNCFLAVSHISSNERKLVLFFSLLPFLLVSLLSFLFLLFVLHANELYRAYKLFRCKISGSKRVRQTSKRRSRRILGVFVTSFGLFCCPRWGISRCTSVNSCMYNHIHVQSHV